MCIVWHSFITGYGIPDRHLAAVCNPMPYPVDLAGKPAPWTLPTKDALTIGAEYFDNVSGHSLIL
jgi:hypothetical protein